MLFILFINDLPECVKNTAKLFADDLKLIVNANMYDTVIDDLDQLEQWENRWLLKFNPSKCKVLHINENNNPMHCYELDETELTAVDSEKDLGVHTSDTLTWTVNMKSAIAKAHSMIAWVTRNVICRSKEVMKAIYTSLIRPHIEYCVQVWSPTPEYGNWGVILEL